MNVLLSHPTGNRNVRSVLTGLNDAGILEAFNTSVAVKPNSSWLNLLPESLKTEFNRRTYPIPYKKINTRFLKELTRMALPKIGFKKYANGQVSWATVDAVYNDLDNFTAKYIAKNYRKKPLSAVYAYEDGAHDTFKQAREMNIKCFYDLPIAYWETSKKLLKEEADRLPDWACTLGGGISDSAEKLDRKIKELELADAVMVPSKFVLDSLPSWASDKKITVAPFGSPVFNGASFSKEERKEEGKPLRVLFVGSMGQRKGLGDLFNAVKMLNTDQIELVVLGKLLAPMEFYKQQYPNFTYESGRSHDQVLALMRSCDVFCLPSLVEGRALVMQEAMSQGLPLIITENTGGDDLVKEGETGFLVPIRSAEKIAEKLSWFLDNRQAIPSMAKFAQQHAMLYTWESYENKIVNSIKNILQ